VECKKSALPSREALQGMVALANLGIDVGPGAVICLAPQLLPLRRTVMAVPVGIV
jgi:hypothetical protein